MPARNIVIAEDTDNDVALLQQALGRAKIPASVRYARDGSEAIQAVIDWKDSDVLLLLDLRMPGVDGFQVLEWLRREHLSRVSAVVMSASLSGDDIRRAGELGARAYVVKPADPSELVRVLERINALWTDDIQARTNLMLAA